ncbi:MAG TPA: glycosyltransferase [Pyrinomonadaceae bacterium]
MSSLAIIMLPEEGHIVPTFKLAKSLIARGHRVCYVVPQNLEQYISAQELECLSVSEDIWQAPAHARPTMPDPVERMNAVIYSNRRQLVELLKSVEIDLLIVDPYMPTVALAAYESGINFTFLNVAFDTNRPFALLDSLQETTGASSASLTALGKVPQLITYPREFEFPQVLNEGRALYHVEASVDLQRSEPAFPWEQIDSSKPLIYCTLGSQCHLFKESRQFFQTIIEAIGARPDWQMILSVGRHLSAEFAALPPNVLVVNWAPQLEILKRASIMITHGGIGTLKDCIFFAVPMIVFPMMRDQPMSGARVVYHGLGVRGDMRHVTVESVQALVEKIERNPAYQQRVREMSEKFREVEESGRGVKIIEKILSVLERKSAHRSSVAVT